LAGAVKEVFDRHRGRYGAPRVWVELRRGGWAVGMSTVASVMAALGLVGKSGRRAVPRTTVADPPAAPAPELLGRDSSPSAPNMAWATDITCLRTGQGWCYLAAIIDCYGRLVAGWAPDNHMRTELCLAALADTTARPRPCPSPRQGLPIYVISLPKGSRCTAHGGLHEPESQLLGQRGD
jgi:transposase InsO family protein